MTPEQKQEYKNKVKAVLDKYLQDNNLVNAERDVIMQHLQSMYRRLTDEDLVQYGLDYAKFVGFAQQAYIMGDLQDHFKS